MRLEQLCLRFPGDEFWIRFHDRLTVLSGIGALERRALLDSVLDALAGDGQSSELTYIDHTGRRVRVSSDGLFSTATYEDDGSEARMLLDALGLDRSGLGRTAVLTAADLGLVGGRRRTESPELAEARTTLAGLAEELQAGVVARQTVEALRAELAAMDEAIRNARDNRSRRDYAQLLADLERARAEAAALRSGRAGADADRNLIASVDGAHHLAAEWKEASAHVARLAEGFGDNERLDGEALDAVASMPSAVPADIDRLADALDEISAERDRLAERLQELAASRLPTPRHPAVAELARVNQEGLWAANRRVLDAQREVEDLSLALGGLPVAEGRTRVVDDIEEHHGEVVAAEETIGRRKKAGLIGSGAGVVAGAAGLAAAPIVAPVALAGAAGAAAWALVAPRRRLARAQRREAEALEQVGAPTYLSFHLRRVDAITDPLVRIRFEEAVAEHASALNAWHELAGGVDPGTALDLADDVRDFAWSLMELGGMAEEVDAVHDDLRDRVEPLVAAARSALLEACVPFALHDPTTARSDVRQLVALGHIGRLQLRLEMAEERERSLRKKLDELLVELGFVEGELTARVGALEWALNNAADRERARSSARDVADVEAELAALEERARSMRRPEFASVTASEASTPDLAALEAKREATASAYATAQALVPDLDHLTDRHRSVERRVAVLEAGQHAGQVPVDIDPADVRHTLLGRLTANGQAGPDRDPLPLFVDDALVRLSAESIWELLGMLERLGEKLQLVYLTDDPYVGTWARRRAAAGAITLLEPTAEPAPITANSI